MTVQPAEPNTDLGCRIEQLERDLAEAVEHQRALSEVLRIISGSPSDLSPVLDAIVASAVRLSATQSGLIFRVEGDRLRIAAAAGLVVPGLGIGATIPLSRGSGTGRAVLERRTIHIYDAATVSEEEFPETRALQRAAGFRTYLATPLLREGEPIGVLNVGCEEVCPLTKRQISLLEAFADQAVIAIENARLFQEIEDKSRQLEVASRHKSEFLANMSHELRTPLNAIIGFSEVLLERMFGDLNERQDEYLRDVLASGQHLLSLINDILDLSKIEAGRMELELGPFSLPEALESGLTMLRERAGRHGVALGLEVDPAVGLVEADERKVKQVLFNLLSNAVKFTPGGGRVDVVARPSGGGQGVLVSVRDTGIGIAPDDLDRVFEEFRQVGQAAARTEGTGLGLALTRKLVELHGGRIWAESQVGVGSTFTFSLPLPGSQPVAGEAVAPATTI